ncbi:hypothetical protein VNI00_006418 [Paramarasmius palmivorus]|uniref:Uncharacterized protein n=1 Tax=Paramarasmius palmivorus TaxID=297713 RepID=A0AAW0D8X1_9AGAR
MAPTIEEVAASKEVSDSLTIDEELFGYEVDEEETPDNEVKVDDGQKSSLEKSSRNEGKGDDKKSAEASGDSVERGSITLPGTRSGVSLPAMHPAMLSLQAILGHAPTPPPAINAVPKNVSSSTSTPATTTCSPREPAISNKRKRDLGDTEMTSTREVKPAKRKTDDTSSVKDSQKTAGAVRRRKSTVSALDTAEDTTQPKENRETQPTSGSDSPASGPPRRGKKANGAPSKGKGKAKANTAGEDSSNKSEKVSAPKPAPPRPSKQRNKKQSQPVLLAKASSDTAEIKCEEKIPALKYAIKHILEKEGAIPGVEEREKWIPFLDIAMFKLYKEKKPKNLAITTTTPTSYDYTPLWCPSSSFRLTAEDVETCRRDMEQSLAEKKASEVAVPSMNPATIQGGQDDDDDDDIVFLHAIPASAVTQSPSLSAPPAHLHPQHHASHGHAAVSAPIGQGYHGIVRSGNHGPAIAHNRSYGGSISQSRSSSHSQPPAPVASSSHYNPSYSSTQYSSHSECASGTFEPLFYNWRNTL